MNIGMVLLIVGVFYMIYKNRDARKSIFDGADTVMEYVDKIFK